MKKGFTLIELLAVIAILAIIMIIAAPKVLDAINNSKLKTYNSTKKLIEKQAEVYLANNTDLLPENVGEYIFVSSADLIANNLVDDEIKLPLTNETTSDFEVRVLKQTDDSYKYDFYAGKRTTSGLIAWYEMNSFKNEDANPTIKDVTGNGYDGTLHNFAYTETSGKTNLGSLKFDGVDDFLTLPSMPQIKSIELKLRINQPNPLSEWRYILDGRIEISNGWVALNGIGGDWIKLYVDGIQKPTATSGYLPLNKISTIYLEVNNNYDTDLFIFSKYLSNEVLDGELYSIRIYNRALTATEILNNYYADR